MFSFSFKPGLSVLAVGALVFALTSSCEGSSDRRETSSPSPTTESVANLDAFDPTTYFAVWNGDVSLPRHPAALMTESEWQRLLTQERSVGLTSMTSDDRRTLLQGALKAYLMLVHSTERTLTSSEGRAHVYEQYSKGDEGLYTLLAAREQSAIKVDTLWPDIVSSRDGPSEGRMFISIGPGGVIVDDWIRRDAGWRCARYDSLNFPFAVLESMYFSRVVNSFLTGPPIRSATFAGRDAVAFELPNDYEDTTSIAWLDARTLFPIGFEYPALASGEHTVGPPAEVHVNALNTAREIPTPAGSCESGE